ncbi:MAG TPA: glycosyltransferase family 4 protein [Afipia sp.]
MLLKIVIVNSRKTHFGDRRATSIDLYVRDLVRFSRYASSTTVIGEPVSEPYPDVTFQPRPVGRFDRFPFRSRTLLSTVTKLAPDVICVQEHLRTAAYLADHLPVPVMLQKHNPLKKATGPIDRLVRTRNYERLGSLSFVSASLYREFKAEWPSVSVPCHVISNGLDMPDWKPARERQNVVLVVGRAVPEKGIKQAAEALASVLPRFPGWRTVFMLNEIEARPDYVAEVRSILNRLGSGATLLLQQPFSTVKAAMETAAIVVVPSIAKEAFGRTALEAHAGGAAVISSGMDGLREISENNAVFLKGVTPEHIADVLAELIADPIRRAALGAAGRRGVEQRFDSRLIASTCDDAYEAMAENRKRRKTASS